MTNEIVGCILLACMIPAGLLRAHIEGKPVIFWVTTSASLVLLLVLLADKYQLMESPILPFLLAGIMIALSIILTAALRNPKLQ